MQKDTVLFERGISMIELTLFGVGARDQALTLTVGGGHTKENYIPFVLPGGKSLYRFCSDSFLMFL